MTFGTTPTHCQPAMQTGTKPKRAERNAPLCRVCGIPLLSKAEAAIGVHIRCVHELNLKNTRNIPRPAYGSRS